MNPTTQCTACSLLLVFYFLLANGPQVSGQGTEKQQKRERQLQQQQRQMQQLLQSISNVDANKDGKVTDEEIVAAFPQADADKDGRISPVEARNYLVRTGDKEQKKPDPSDRIKPTRADVAYGPHERNVLDFYQAKSDKPTPLVIFIHGGGFVAGNKSSISPAIVEMAQAAGISMASLNYRFVNGTDIIFPAPQHDCARAVQFLRSKAMEWNIDPKRVACYGGSAGAGISMWLGFHEDLADPSSSDPLARLSTRIVAIGTMGGQGTYDPIKIKELIGGRAWEHPSIFKIYGVKSAAEALHPTAAQQKLYDEGSAITHLTKDDAPLYMIYNEPDIPPAADARPGDNIHHPNFGKQLKKAMDALGIENVYVHTDNAAGRDPQREMIEFFQKAFSRVK